MTARRIKLPKSKAGLLRALKSEIKRRERQGYNCYRKDHLTRILDALVELDAKEATPYIMNLVYPSREVLGWEFNRTLGKAIKALCSREYIGLYLSRYNTCQGGAMYSNIVSLRDPESIPIILARASMSKRSAFYDVKDMLSGMGLPESLPPLFEGIEKCKGGDTVDNHEYSAWCQSALVHMHGEELIPHFERYVQSGHNTVYVTALQALQNIGTDKAKQLVIGALEDNKEDIQRRNLALQILCMIDDDAQVERILDTYADDDTLDYRTKEDIKKHKKGPEAEQAAATRGKRQRSCRKRCSR